MDSAATFKCNDNRFKSLLAGYLDKDSVDWKGLVCGYMGKCALGVQFF